MHGPATESLWHGYTPTDIDQLARKALAADRWRAGDTDERLAAIRFAIVEHLCTTDTAPTRHDLVAIGLRASDTHVQHEMHHHGWDRQHIGAGRGAMPSFQRYWTATPTPGPEKQVVEKLARTQIWAQLTPREQQAIVAMAETADYRLAGQALSLDANAFGNLLSAARRRFLACWHEGEEPSRLWRMTKRTSSLDGMCRGVPRLRASQVERMRLRRSEGATLREIGQEWGVAISTVSRYLRGDVTPVPDLAGSAA